MRQHRGAAAPGRSTKGRPWVAVALLPAALLVGVVSAPAQPAAAERIFYSRNREFRIPFTLDAGEGRIAGVKLHVSENFGNSWQASASASATSNERFFPFRTERDGWYWFTVQMIDGQNRAYPPVIDAQTLPGLKVCVDTREPLVTLRQATPSDGGVGVSWSVQDENLNNLKNGKADTLVLEYRPSGRGGTWTRVPVDQKVNGQRSWAPEGNGPLEVRLRALDDASNEGQQTITVNGGSGGGRVVTPGYAGETAGAAPRSGAPDRTFVKTKVVNLKYDVEEKGKSGISEVQLWYTDGQTWVRRGEAKDPIPPYVYKVELANEGLYGFTLLARSGVGLALPEPRAGEPPQVWIEADWTKPVVALQGVEVGRGQDSGVLFLTYTAEDKNLDPRGSISFSYREKETDEWTKFADKQDNVGRYRWQMPPSGVPFQFHVRVTATDRAGNDGFDQTKEPVKVDLVRPKAMVRDVEPVGGP